ncbi:conjugal transfer protein [Photorhabdus heterorhabditis]|uniref:Conjugal transfer protein n=1 Tax=Photorhabdus heterorhabditis TaxID=880156 RepID=A0ABR5KAF3_9GAMM|nr:plasmid transfer ATPase TraJ [Photorhabdus heterorhabditis]KOY61564.1 conjugal transfer protein [Photorhabdus heterorhabditis]
MTPLIHYDFSRGLNADNLRGFFVHCYRHGVSDIHIQSGSPLIVDHYGRKVIVSQFRLEHSNLIRLTDEIFSTEIKAQVQSGNGVDRSLQLEGDSNGRYQLARGERVRFRCNFIQGTIGNLNTAVAVTLRVIPSLIPTLDSLELEEDLRKSLLPLNGLGLVCGETGSGKSTLLASTYQHYGETHPDGKVVTYEDPVEYLLGGPKWVLQPQQCQIGRDVKSFADGLRLSLRQAPTVIGIGEIRDLETLQAAITCAQFGQLALSTLHAFSPGHAFSRCCIMAPEETREQIASDLLNALRYIIVQRLIPTTDGKRTAVREYVIFNDEWRRKLAQHHYTRWPEMINASLRDSNSRIVDRTWQLFINNRINAQIAEKIMGWQEFSDKQRAA